MLLVTLDEVIICGERLSFKLIGRCSVIFLYSRPSYVQSLIILLVEIRNKTFVDPSMSPRRY